MTYASSLPFHSLSIGSTFGVFFAHQHHYNPHLPHFSIYVIVASNTIPFKKLTTSMAVTLSIHSSWFHTYTSLALPMRTRSSSRTKADYAIIIMYNSYAVSLHVNIFL